MSARDLERARAKVADVLQQRQEPIAPRDLVAMLQPQGVLEDEVRLAMWDLIDQQKLSITDDNKLEMISAS